MPDADALMPASKPPASNPATLPETTLPDAEPLLLADPAIEIASRPISALESTAESALESGANPKTDAQNTATNFGSATNEPTEITSDAALTFGDQTKPAPDANSDFEAQFQAELDAEAALLAAQNDADAELDAEFEDIEFESDYAAFDASQFENDEAEAASATDDDTPETERISKLIAKAGLASRRAAEEMIAAGRVTLNGHVVTEQGLKADALNDRIVVDGHPLRLSEKPGVVLVFHKPRLVMTTKDDPGGRSTVMDFLPRKWQSLHPVGRLDFDTSGVLLLTDDGTLTHLLTHPSHGAEKVYEARVRGVVEPAAIEKLERGVRLDDGPTAPCRAKLMAQRDKNALIQLVLREGRNRQVRRMLEAVGHPAGALRRISFAGIELEGLAAGEFRILLPGEIKALRRRVESKVKKLSAPKGKFHKQKRPVADAIKGGATPTETEAFKVPHKRLERAAIVKTEGTASRVSQPVGKSASTDKRAAKSEQKPVARRPRNAPKAPEAPRLERKGSKARALSDAQQAGKPAPRPKPAPRAEIAPRLQNAPRPESGTEAPKPSRPRRAPVASRVDKRWKS